MVELCRAIARRHGRAPWLLLAGDAGQTVRPTGFDWGPLNDLLARRVRAPVRFHLEEHLRCPSRIAEVIERASERYADVVKDVRPTKQHRQVGGQHVDAHVVHVQVADRAAAVRLLEDLADADDVVVLAPGNDRPAWVPDRLRDGVLTPAEAKGLEYQSVCVLDPGRVLSSLRPLEAAYGAAAELDEQARRTAIDHLRVTLSRATETLVFVDVAPGDRERALSLELLGDAAPYDPEDLVDHFAHAEASPDERVLARTNDARALIDSAPGRAWQRARQAIRLLGDPDLPNGVSDPAVRRDARTTLMATAARLLVDGPPGGVSRGEVYRAALDALIVRVVPPRARRAARRVAPASRAAAGGGDLDTAESAEAGVEDRTYPPMVTGLEATLLHALDNWSESRTGPPFELLEAARELGAAAAPGQDWARDALLPAAQALRDGVTAGAADPEQAGAFADGDVEAWLRLTGYSGDAAARARVLRTRAFDALLKSAGPTCPPRCAASAARRPRRCCRPSRPIRCGSAGCARRRDGRRRRPPRTTRPARRRRCCACGGTPARGMARGRAGRQGDPRRSAVAHRARGARRPAARAAEPAPAERRARPPRTAARHRPEAPPPQGGRVARK